MIGDNLETDILFGINSNITTLLVLTGTPPLFPSLPLRTRVLTPSRAGDRCHPRVPPHW